MDESQLEEMLRELEPVVYDLGSMQAPDRNDVDLPLELRREFGISYARTPRNVLLLFNELARSYAYYGTSFDPLLEFDIDEDLLRPFYYARFLDGDLTRELIELPRGEVSRSDIEWFNRFYLDTGIDDLDVRNAVVYMAALLGAEVAIENKRASRIPTLINDYTDISKSHPQLQLMVDVVYLALAGVVSVPKNRRDAKNRFLQGVVNNVEEDFYDVMSDPVLSWFLTAEKSEALLNDDLNLGMFGTSLYFNLDRMLNKDYPVRDFSSFRRFYSEGFDDVQLNVVIMDHFGEQASSLGRKLGREFLGRLEANIDDYEGIAQRDFANTLWHLYFIMKRDGVEYEEAKKKLPPVALFGMGAKEYEASSEPIKRGYKRSGKGTTDHSVSAPDLDRIMDLPVKVRKTLPKDDKVYVLDPRTYSGELPDDGRVFMSRALGPVYGEDVRPDYVRIDGKSVLMRGRSRLVRGNDPVDDCVESLRNSGYKKVEVLR